MQDANLEQLDAPDSTIAERGSKLHRSEVFRARLHSFALCLMFLMMWTLWGWATRKAPSDSTGIPTQFVIDLNVATEPELNLLPGVGPKLAQEILEYREQRGGFESIEDLTKIRGIKEGRLLALRKYLQIGPSKER